MDNEVSVGARLRCLRRERHLSQKALAKQCGLSLNAISLTERDEISPNVATLQRLAAALGVQMGGFFAGEFGADRQDRPDRPDQQAGVIYVKAGQCQTVTTGGVTIAGICSGRRLAGQQLQPFLLTLAPHADIGSRHLVYTGHEFVCCIKGTLTYEVDETGYVLARGDMLLFDAALPHSCQNPGEEEAQCLLVLQVPSGPPDSIRGPFLNYPSTVPIG